MPIIRKTSMASASASHENLSPPQKIAGTIFFTDPRYTGSII
jgi:hypothetical protein